MTIQTTVIPAKYVFVQSTTPTDTTEGKLWYNTTNNTLYTSDGSSYSAMETDVTEIQKILQENAIQILINSAGATTTLNDWDDMYIDRFTDADGQLNTVDTGNTTATFITDRYKNAGSDVVDAHGFTIDDTNSTSAKMGERFTVVNSCTITKVVKTANATGMTKCYIYASHNPLADLLGEATADGNDFVFNVDVSATDVIYIVFDDAGASDVYSKQIGASYPYNMTNLNMTSTCDNTTTATDRVRTLESVTSNIPANKLLQTDMATITANPTGHQLFCKNTLGGAGAITYDVSFDNGSTWVTGQALNTKNTDVHAGTQMIIKVNLTGAGANTVEVNNYAIMLFY